VVSVPLPGLLIETPKPETVSTCRMVRFSPVAGILLSPNTTAPRAFAARFSPVAGILLIETPEAEMLTGKTFVSDFGRCLTETQF